MVIKVRLDWALAFGLVGGLVLFVMLSAVWLLLFSYATAPLVLSRPAAGHLLGAIAWWALFQAAINFAALRLALFLSEGRRLAGWTVAVIASLLTLGYLLVWLQFNVFGNFRS